MSGKTLGQVGYEAFTAVRYAGSLTTGWTHPSVAHKAWEATGQAVAAHVASTAAEDFDSAAEITRLRGVLERLADHDVWVLDSGLGGGFSNEHHVRTNLARQAIGRDVCGCTDCCVSLGIEPEDRP